MRFLTDLSLEKRIPLYAGMALVIILVTFMLLDLQAVNESRNRSLQERLVTAQMISSHIDLTLQQAIRMLEKTSVLLAPGLENLDLEREKAIMTSAYAQLGVFDRNLILLDRNGNLLWSVSQSESCQTLDKVTNDPLIEHVMRSGIPSVSSVQRYLEDGTSTVCLMSPIRSSSGEIIGMVGGSLAVADQSIGGFVSSLKIGRTGYAEIVDAEGVVLGNANKDLYAQGSHSERLAKMTKEKQTAVTTCHNCHEPAGSPEERRDILAFAPVSAANWGVIIRQSEDEVFTEAHDLERKLASLTFLSVLVVVFMAWISTRAVTRPLGSITQAAERIASGDLSHGVSFPGKDEIGRLSRAFEVMRIQLKDYLGQIKDWNRELEERVQQRTLALEESRREITHLYEELQQKEQARRNLLGRIITIQEEERHRLARELHDETSQALTALVVGLETTTNSPSQSAAEIKARVGTLRPIVIETLNEVHRLIFDLRPSSLDDLGLIAALQSYSETRLEAIGIRVLFRAKNMEQRLPAQTESALFRIVQEALTNVVKHAEADNVTVRLEFQNGDFLVSVEDDGRGFNVEEVLHANGRGRGFGLMGISERVALLGGEVSIFSHPGQGTAIDVRIPNNDGGEKNGYYKSINS